MTYVPTDFAEAQAIGLCWMARQQPSDPGARIAGKGGLPEIPILRQAVVQLHPGECGWCQYPLEELMAMLGASRVMARAETHYWAMPGKARLAAIRTAQGEAVEA